MAPPRITCLLYTLCITLLLCQLKRTEASYSQFVNNFIGTGGYGFGIGSNPPGAQRPFGLVRVSPDTINDYNFFIPFNHFGGYYYLDSTIRVFSHTHMVGSGVVDYGTVGVMPLNRYPTALDVMYYGFRSTFSHLNESASPGYYRVYLRDSRVMVELTATEHVGYHRYTFDPQSPKVILFPSHVLSPYGATNASININPSTREVSGWIVDNGDMARRIGGYTTYFVARFPTSFESFGTWVNYVIQPGSTSAAANSTNESANIGAYVSFGLMSPSVIEFAVGISSISVEQARANLESEVGSQSFNDVLSKTQAMWERALSIADAQGREEDLVKFYTALYRILSSPTIFDEGGKYLGFDMQVHQLPSNMTHYYTDMSIWDTHRTQFPFFALIRPDILSDIVNSLLLMYQQGGDLPRWPFANGYTGSMIGTHGIIVIVDAYMKGIRSFDLDLAYKAMKQAATMPQKHAGRADLSNWIKKGYVASDVSQRGCSETLEYAYDDWALGNFAKVIGELEDAEIFLNRSKNYKNVWYDPGKHFCARRSDGTFDCPITWLNVFDSRYVEGDAEHWRWFVPHDAHGLIELFGSTSYFVSELTNFFEYSKLDPFNILPNPYWWPGNEPDLFAPYLFNFAGRADLTQKYVRWNLYEKYLTSPDGLPGNDDYGTMSAWFMFGALGFYPLAGSTTYMIGSPLLDKVTLHLPTGDLTIIAYNNSPENYYVQKAAINGQPIDMTKPFLDHSQLVSKGGVTLEFWMGNTQPPYIKKEFSN